MVEGRPPSAETSPHVVKLMLNLAEGGATPFEIARRIRAFCGPKQVELAQTNVGQSCIFIEALALSSSEGMGSFLAQEAAGSTNSDRNNAS